MSDATEQHHLQDGSIYRIVLRGRLDPERSAWFEGMAIANGNDGAGRPVVTLEGSLPDQAALHGVLNNLHALGLTLLRVELVERETSA